MNTFPPDIRFRKPWRSYQQRVLDELKDHLDDNHLHIIAAPGSGKTVLGLEVMRRLNRPALILSPTVAIRDQWVDRYIGLCGPIENPRSSVQEVVVFTHEIWYKTNGWC
jgi:superfamily II DNA or RNA helicase